jgi:phenylglyoxylate dehydrogenase epsilon subunit
MTHRKHLIIGCGWAAISALEKIRSITSEDEIKMVTRENYPPYCPTVLPYLLSGRTQEADIFTRDQRYFQRMKVAISRSKEVVRVLPRGKEVIYKDGEREKYDTLLIASGSESARPRIKGLKQAGFLGFHTLSDYRELVGRLGEGNEVAILGAGLVGMQVASALSLRGHKVIVLEKEKEVLPVSFEQPVGSYVTGIYSGQGVDVFTGKELKEVKRTGPKVELICRNGDLFNADLIVCCVGVASRLSMVRGSGINANRGILVDNRMRTNLEDIYAAGDIAEAPGFFTGEHQLIPILPNAVIQGKIAGANMAGEEDEYEGGIPMNVFNFFGNRAFSIGLFKSLQSNNGSQVLEKKDDKRRRFKRLVYRGDKLIGAMFLNVEVDPGVILYLIKKQANIGHYTQVLFNRPKEISRWLMLETERKETLALEIL